MKYDYYIANIYMRIHTDFELTNDEYSQHFLQNSNNLNIDFDYYIYAVDDLPIFDGIKVSETIDTVLYRDGKYLWQEYLNGKEHLPLTLAHYSVNNCENGKMYILKSEMPYTSRTTCIWSAMDLPHLLLQNNIVTLHSASIEVDNQAILFVASSGVGKSTQSNLWNKFRNVRQLNGDKVALLIDENNIIATGLPFCGTSGICEKYNLPIKAIVLLYQSSNNEISMLKGIKALTMLSQHCPGHYSIPENRNKIIELLIPVIEKIPILYFGCTADEKAVICLEKYLKEVI